MNKPFTLKVQETEQKIVEIVNNAEIPAFCMKVILNDVLNQINDFDKKEIENYYKELKKENEKEKEE